MKTERRDLGEVEEARVILRDEETYLMKKMRKKAATKRIKRTRSKFFHISGQI